MERIGIGLGRGVASLATGNDFARPLFFMHLPKCGGSSLTHALKRNVPINRRIGVIDANATRMAAGIYARGQASNLAAHEDRATPEPTFMLREQILLMHLAWQTSLIIGHVLWSDKAWQHFQGRFDAITMMREPMDRTLSNLNFNFANHIYPAPESVDELLDSALAWHHATCLVRYFAGAPKARPEDMATLFARARVNAARFKLIGALENFPAFARAMKLKFGYRINLPRLNTAATNQIELTTRQRDRLRVLCAYDRALYQEFHDWNLK